MDKNIISALIITVLIALFTILFSILSTGNYNEHFALLPEGLNFFSYILIGIVSSLIATLLLRIMQNKNSDLSIAYSISMFGFPKSGKTTMITTLFSMIMYRKVDLKGYEAIVKGDSTIEKINKQIEQLEKGIPIESTNDQTLFAYRINLEPLKKNLISSLFSNRKYKVEIGDFPGERSEDFVKKDLNAFKRESDYFNWAKDADVFIFVVDLGKFFLNNKVNYKAEISSSIRAAWQNLIEIHSNQVSAFRRKPVLLIFNKADIFLDFNSEYEGLSHRAFSVEGVLPRTIEVAKESHNHMLYKEFTASVEAEFENLIVYLREESSSFQHIFMSSFCTLNDEKIGFQEMINHIIPRR